LNKFHSWDKNLFDNPQNFLTIFFKSKKNSGEFCCDIFFFAIFGEIFELGKNFQMEQKGKFVLEKNDWQEKLFLEEGSLSIISFEKHDSKLRKKNFFDDFLIRRNFFTRNLKIP